MNKIFDTPLQIAQIYINKDLNLLKINKSKFSSLKRVLKIPVPS